MFMNTNTVITEHWPTRCPFVNRVHEVWQDFHEFQYCIWMWLYLPIFFHIFPKSTHPPKATFEKTKKNSWKLSKKMYLFFPKAEYCTYFRKKLTKDFHEKYENYRCCNSTRILVHSIPPIAYRTHTIPIIKGNVFYFHIYMDQWRQCQRIHWGQTNNNNTTTAIINNVTENHIYMRGSPENRFLWILPEILHFSPYRMHYTYVLFITIMLSL